MTFGCYNKMNMLGMGNMLGGLGNMFGGTNVISQLFSGTNSIFGGGFNMYGNYGTGSCGLFMDCKGNYNYDAMAGFAVGGALLNVAGAAIGSVIENKKENSVENLDTKVEEAQEEVKTKKENYSTKDEELKTLHNKTTELQNASKAATITYDIAMDYITKNEKAYKAASEKKKNNTPLTSNEEQLINEYEKYSSKLTDLRNAKEKANTELTAHNEAVEKKNAEVKEAKEELETAKAELKAAQEAVQEAKLNKADGNMLNRTSEKQFKELFRTDESGNETLDPEAKISKADVRFAILGYKNAKTDEDRKAWAKKFQNLYNKLDTVDANNKNISAAYEIIKKDFRINNKY